MTYLPKVIHLGSVGERFTAGVDGHQRLEFAHLGLSKGSHCGIRVLSPGTLLVQAFGGLAQPSPILFHRADEATDLGLRPRDVDPLSPVSSILTPRGAQDLEWPFPLLGLNFFICQMEEIIPEVPAQLSTQCQVIYTSSGGLPSQLVLGSSFLHIVSCFLPISVS